MVASSLDGIRNNAFFKRYYDNWRIHDHMVKRKQQIYFLMLLPRFVFVFTVLNHRGAFYLFQLRHSIALVSYWRSFLSLLDVSSWTANEGPDSVVKYVSGKVWWTFRSSSLSESFNPHLDLGIPCHWDLDSFPPAQTPPSQQIHAVTIMESSGLAGMTGTGLLHGWCVSHC